LTSLRHDRGLSQIALRIGEELARRHPEAFGDEQTDHGGEDDPPSMGHCREYERDTGDESVRRPEDGGRQGYRILVSQDFRLTTDEMYRSLKIQLPSELLDRRSLTWHPTTRMMTNDSRAK